MAGKKQHEFVDDVDTIELKADTFLGNIADKAAARRETDPELDCRQYAKATPRAASSVLNFKGSHGCASLSVEAGLTVPFDIMETLTASRCCGFNYCARNLVEFSDLLSPTGPLGTPIDASADAVDQRHGIDQHGVDLGIASNGRVHPAGISPPLAGGFIR
jgi:hypothetical protein